NLSFTFNIAPTADSSQIWLSSKSMMTSLSDAISNFLIKVDVEAKNNGPFTLYMPSISSICTREILATKMKVLKMTPITTPIAKLLVYKITATVTIITTDSDFGACFKIVNELQLNVVIATIIIIPTRTGMGISTTISPKTIIKNNKNAPATKVDKRPRPPDFTLITDRPINAQ